MAVRKIKILDLPFIKQFLVKMHRELLFFCENSLTFAGMINLLKYIDKYRGGV